MNVTASARKQARMFRPMLRFSNGKTRVIGIGYYYTREAATSVAHRYIDRVWPNGVVHVQESD